MKDGPKGHALEFGFQPGRGRAIAGWGLLVALLVLVAGPVRVAAKIPPKRPSDVYAHAILLKKEIEYLRHKHGITEPFPELPLQTGKQPRHVIQKALEILSKINRYRLINGYGPIYIPPYPPRDITPQDVYEIVKRLNGEVRLFIHDEEFLSSLKLRRYENKTPSHVYTLLWSISLAMDPLIGIRGYTPSDIYALSEKLVAISRFLRETQNISAPVERPALKPNQHPNHALYATHTFLQKVALAERKLWIEPAEVPPVPHRVISPIEVYDALQYTIAELQRIKYRLGLERYFEIKPPTEKKTFSDVVQNIEYATLLLPDFSQQRPLIQYPTSSLKKTPNEVFSVTEVIRKKLEILRNLRGIQARPKTPPYIEGLKPIHVYQKGIEAIEKGIRLKEQMGFYPSYVPSAPFRPITPSEVYELMLRLDGIVTQLLNRAGYTEAKEYIYMINKPFYTGKVPSDVYQNLWRITYLIDLISGSEYTPNETFALATEIRRKIELLLKSLGLKFEYPHPPKVMNKRPKDVFLLALELHGLIKRAQKRANMEVRDISIPRETVITPNTVYNALRLINASLNELLIFLGIDAENISVDSSRIKGKTPSDVFQQVETSRALLKQIFSDEIYLK